ncbi:hypothetical protein AALO_G00129690 [Alosa alosa]|uniref:Fibronectin type-III domain-containing protein n=1 Tax=Alosa alosa TaxID=278164 RepID=A0AAV6GRR5_9TELE|nr:hypothetical protein AALO_G00129690 [Alosa alosa]
MFCPCFCVSAIPECSDWMFDIEENDADSMMIIIKLKEKNPSGNSSTIAPSMSTSIPDISPSSSIPSNYVTDKTRAIENIDGYTLEFSDGSSSHWNTGVPIVISNTQLKPCTTYQINVIATANTSRICRLNGTTTSFTTRHIGENEFSSNVTQKKRHN